MSMPKMPRIVRLAIVGTMGFVTGAAWSAHLEAAGPSAGPPPRDVAAERESRTRSELERMLSRFGVGFTASPARARGWRQTQLDWNRPDGDVPVARGEGASERKLTIRGERVAEAAPARLRALELADTQILVVATDARRELKWWTVISDPRTVRAETVDEQGSLMDGGSVFRGSVAFSLDVPDDPEIQHLEVYHPRWNGAEFELEPLAAVATARK